MEKSYVRGIIGALIGGIIASIPWILVYVYANMIYSILAVFVAMGALKGYQLFNGKIDKKLPIIIVVISVLSITVSTLVIIPALLLLKEGTFDIANIKLLYGNDEFFKALMGDYAISILFTFLGISGVVSSIRRQIINNQDVNISFSDNNSRKNREKVREYFVSRGATSENNLIQLDKNSDINMETVNSLMADHIIIKKDDMYYFNVEEDDKLKKSQKKTLVITSVILVAVISAFIVMFIFINNSEKNSGIAYYDIPKSYEKIDDDENENSWFYLPKSDQSGDSGYFTVYYLDGDYVYSSLFVESAIEGFQSYEDFKEINDSKYFKNDNKLDVMYFSVAFQEYTDYVYYIFGDGRIGIVEVFDYNNNESLQKDGRKTVDSFKWNN
jgi:flagellar basal body-associated protein FliL